jgi:ABC-2 type transport system ATP-binding protein
MSETYIELINLQKTFRDDLLKKDQIVLNSLNCSFAKGECTGLLGHNGAGKTTTIKMILGLLKPDNGTIRINGKSLTTESKRNIGYMAEVNKLPATLTPIEILNNQLRIFNPKKYSDRSTRKKRILEKLEEVGLGNHSSKLVRNMSKGMGRRLAWAVATIHEPEFLILDEPSSGLDPLGRHKMLEWIKNEKKRGTTIMLCTHELAQINILCDNFHILNNGRLVLTTTKDDTVKSLASGNLNNDWRHNYNLHLSGADEKSLKQLGDQQNLLPWQGFKQEGYLTVLGFAEYTDACAWMGAALQAGLIIVRFGDQLFMGEEELLPYFEAEEQP